MSKFADTARTILEAKLAPFGDVPVLPSKDMDRFLQPFVAELLVANDCCKMMEVIKPLPFEEQVGVISYAVTNQLVHMGVLRAPPMVEWFAVNAACLMMMDIKALAKQHGEAFFNNNRF